MSKRIFFVTIIMYDLFNNDKLGLNRKILILKI